MTRINRREWTPPDVVYDDGLISRGYARPTADGGVLAVGRTVRGHIPIGVPLARPLALFRLDGQSRITRLAVLPGTAVATSNATPVYGGVDILPEGARVAYVTSDSATGVATGLRILTVATGATVLIDANGNAPRWASDGTMLAYTVAIPQMYQPFDGRLYAANADGSAKRALSPTMFAPGQPDWR